MIINKTEVTDTPLVLGDYVTVHVPVEKTDLVNNSAPSDMQVHREELFKRIQKQRGESLKHLQKRGGVLIDPRRRGVA